MDNVLEKPKLSIVVTSRNDNHGGDLNYRMQLFIDSILDHAKTNKTYVELIIVEWNPPIERVKLKEALDWIRKNDWCNVRIIEVPNEIHQKYHYSNRLPLYQMIGKNVGIRRATGEFILVTNIDIIFSEQLFKFINSDKLEKEKMYRVNRYDVDNKMSLKFTNEEKLDYCEKNLLRINGRYSTKSFIANEEYMVYSKEVKDICELNNLKEPLFTNACGDFQLAHREHWFQLNGYPEFDMYSMHIDSIFEYMASYMGLEEVVLEYPMVTYHIEHSAGFQPENNSLDNKLKKEKILSIEYHDLLSLAKRMLDMKAPIIFNKENWGMADLILQEYSVNDSLFRNKFKIVNSEYEPTEICCTEKWIHKIRNEMRIDILSFGSKNFEEWIKKVMVLNSFWKIKRTISNTTKKIDTRLFVSNFKLSKNQKKMVKEFDISNKDIIVFGSGSGYKRFVKPVLEYFNVKPKYIVDNDVNKVGAFIDGIRIESAEKLINENKENVIILISSIFYDEITKQLNDLGFNENDNFVKAFLYFDIVLNNIIEQLDIVTMLT